jgi:hypothetical protein
MTPLGLRAHVRSATSSYEVIELDVRASYFL